MTMRNGAFNLLLIWIILIVMASICYFILRPSKHGGFFKFIDGPLR
jgi:cbb3-type cytochrome oxidase subunit 3